MTPDDYSPAELERLYARQPEPTKAQKALDTFNEVTAWFVVIFVIFVVLTVAAWGGKHLIHWLSSMWTYVLT